jgi:hypothetical protein
MEHALPSISFRLLPCPWCGGSVAVLREDDRREPWRTDQSRVVRYYCIGLFAATSLFLQYLLAEGTSQIQVSIDQAPQRSFVVGNSKVL